MSQVFMSAADVTTHEYSLKMLPRVLGTSYKAQKHFYQKLLHMKQFAQTKKWKQTSSTKLLGQLEHNDIFGISTVPYWMSH